MVHALLSQGKGKKSLMPPNASATLPFRDGCPSIPASYMIIVLCRVVV